MRYRWQAILAVVALVLTTLPASISRSLALSEAVGECA